MPAWLSWIYRRWGQTLCFALGGFMTFYAFGDQALKPGVALGSGAIFLATALGLKALTIWKERPPR